MGVSLERQRVHLDDKVIIRRATTSHRKLLDESPFAGHLLTLPYSGEIDQALWAASVTSPFEGELVTRDVAGDHATVRINTPEGLGLQVCTILRLINDAWCSAPVLVVADRKSTWYESNAMAFPEYAWASRPHSHEAAPLTIVAGDPPVLRLLWHLTSEALTAGNPGLRQAIMAFNRSWSYRPIDAAECIAELVRGLEALFVYESVEVSYRLGLRCACLLSNDPRVRTSMRAQLKAGYDVRSKVVHGSSIPRSVKIEGKSVDLRDFAPSIRSTLRLAIGSFLLLLPALKEDEFKKKLLDDHILSGSVSDISKVLTAQRSIRLLRRLGNVPAMSHRH